MRGGGARRSVGGACGGEERRLDEVADWEKDQSHLLSPEDKKGRMSF